LARDQNEDDLYSRAQCDPVFLQEVRAAYDGRHDSLDALWWKSHPADPAPSGALPPSAALSDLQRRVFSADGGSLGDHDTTRELRELEAQLSADHRAIQNAIAAASAWRTGRRADPSADTGEPAPAATDGLIETDATSATGAATRTLRSRGPIRNLLVAFCIAAALICGAIIGAQMSNTDADASPPASPSVDPKPTAAPLTAALIFKSAQVPSDLPAQPMPETLVRDSFRNLLPAEASSTRNGIYAARSTSNMICLVALTSESAYVSSCAVESEFPVIGLRVYWSADIDYLTSDGAAISTPTDLNAVWKPDGSVESGGTGRTSSEG